MQNPPPTTITDEISGDQYADLNAVQRAALPLFSDDLQSVIRDLLDRGVLIIVDGKVIPNPQGSNT
jgi:hypothetical protein